MLTFKILLNNIMNLLWNFIKLLFSIMSFFIFSKAFLIFYLLWAITSFFLIKKIMKQTEKYRIIKGEDKEIDEKYKEFRRLDGKCWNEIHLLIGALLFGWIKLLGCIFTIVFCYITLKIITRGLNIEDYTDKTLRRKVELIIQISAKLVRLSFGIFVEEERVEYDYIKFLGPDYKKNEKPAAYISNHTSWLDIVLLLDKTGSGFISSIHVKSFPMIGYIATILGCIFVDRDDKKNRENSLNMVNSKLLNIYNGVDLGRIAIFPEGTTSNTTSILPFKKGAFATKLPLKPYVVTFEVVKQISLAMDVIEIMSHAFVIMFTPYHWIKLYSLPIFSPNEYFFTNNNTGKDDWQYYADTVRDIMCNVSGLRKSHNGSWEEKSAYLKFLRHEKEN
jgi:1-acyl-sn-glycerol-3-phosphate acyltransferase